MLLINLIGYFWTNLVMEPVDTDMSMLREDDYIRPRNGLFGGPRRY